MSYRISQCVFCKHFNHLRFNCVAFPKGIPGDILHNIHRHTVKEELVIKACYLKQLNGKLNNSLINYLKK